jgi:hypothetical protein
MVRWVNLSAVPEQAKELEEKTIKINQGYFIGK